MTLGTDLPFLPQDLVTTPGMKDVEGNPLVCRVTGFERGAYLLKPLESDLAKCRVATDDPITLIERGTLWRSVHLGA
jgi:hypothetical protein